MSDQLSIDFLPPASHARDPISSFRAEPKANIKGQALTLLHLLREHGPATMRELSEATGFDYYVAQKRVSVLYANNLTKKPTIRPCHVTGNDCQCWTAI